MRNTICRTSFLTALCVSCLVIGDSARYCPPASRIKFHGFQCCRKRVPNGYTWACYKAGSETPAKEAAVTTTAGATDSTMALSENLNDSTTFPYNVATTTPTTTTTSTAEPRAERTHLDYLPSFEIGYLLFSTTSNMEIYCRTASPTVPGLLTILGVRSVTVLTLNDCEVPTPPLTYKDVLEGNEMNITDLTLLGPLVANRILGRITFSGIAESVVSLKVERFVFDNIALDFFESFESLKKLTLRDTQLKSLSPSIRSRRKLTKLHLSRNSIASITTDTFSSLQSLEELRLALNPIQEIQARSFVRLKNLTELAIHGSPISEIPPGSFEGLSSLTELRLISLSNMTTLPQGIFDGMPELKVLKIMSGGLTSLPDDIFTPLRNLEQVDLGNNHLSMLPSFQTNLKLKELTILDNKIEQVDGKFKGLRQLRVLDLANNSLRRITTIAFAGLFLLDTLDLRKNRIETIDEEAFLDLTMLRTLNLGDNRLSSFSFRLIDDHEIKNIFLARNRLKGFPDMFKNLPRLESVNLDNNQIRSLNVPMFLSKKTSISILDNLIENVVVNDDYDGHADLNERHVFHLEGNPFQCNCDNYEFLNYLRNENSHIAKFEDKHKYVCNNMSNTSCLAVKLNEINSEIRPCPSTSCKCFMLCHDLSRNVRCEGLNSSGNLPKFPEDVSHLNLSGNALDEYPKQLGAYQSLTHIYLDDNRIRRLDSAFENINVAFPPKLELLSLKGNLMKTTPEVVPSIPFRIALSRNNWTCGCSVMHFWTFIVKNIASIDDYDKIECHPGIVHDGRMIHLLKDIKKDLFCPSDFQLYRIIIASVSILFTIVLLLIGLYYKNRHLVCIYLYTYMPQVFRWRLGRVSDEEKLYDGFMSFSSSDRDIAEALREALEEPSGKGATVFKLCFRYRDFNAGVPYIEEVDFAVESSRRTIFVLSKHHLNSTRFKMELEAASSQMMKDHMNRIIVVIVGDIPPEDSLSPILRNLLKMKKPRLVWGERWFWERLHYAMTHKKLPKTRRTSLDQLKMVTVDRTADPLSANTHELLMEHPQTITSA